MCGTLALSLLASVTCFAGQQVTFFETWEPPPPLLDLWRPVCDCWWDARLGMNSPRIALHFKNFARSHSPDAIVPEIFADLKIHDTKLVESAYVYLLAQWPRQHVLSLLEPDRHSSDPQVRREANEFYADLVNWKS